MFVIRQIKDVQEVNTTRLKAAHTCYRPVSPFATPLKPTKSSPTPPSSSSAPLAAAHLCFRALPPLASVSFQTRTTTRLQYAKGHSPDSFSTNAGNFVVEHSNHKHTQTSISTTLCLRSEVCQPLSRSRPSVPTRRTRRGPSMLTYTRPRLHTDFSQSIHRCLSPK